MLQRWLAALLIALALLAVPARAAPPEGAVYLAGASSCRAPDAFRTVLAADPARWQPLTADWSEPRSNVWLRIPVPPAWPPRMLVVPADGAHFLYIYRPGAEAPEVRDRYLPTPPFIGTGRWHSVMLPTEGSAPLLICLVAPRVFPGAVRIVDAGVQIERELALRTLIVGSLAVMLTMLVLAGVLWLGLSDRIYLVFFLQVAVFAFWLGLNDYALAPWFVDLPGGADTLNFIRRSSSILAVAIGIHFARRFMDMAHGSPRIDRGLRGAEFALIGMVVIHALAAPLGMPHGWVLTTVNVAAGLCSLILIPASLAMAWRGNRHARFFCVGWTPMLLVVVWATAHTVWLTAEAATVRLWLFPAAAFQCVLLALGLMDRTLTLKRERDAARELAERDPLTGLLNRRGFLARLEQQLADRRGVALLVCDLDHFKRINDTHGHAAGDRCLQAFARRSRDLLPPAAVIARYGGEEFAVVVPLELHDPAQVAEHLRAGIGATPVEVGRESLRLTVSIGVAKALPGSKVDAAALLGQADRALYRAKDTGRNRVQVAGLESARA
jgi:diguanylate cyclase (GGDEF)-like protein